MPKEPDLAFIRSLYGGYWNYDIKDFCYMINPYFPPQKMLDEIAVSFRHLATNYPSTNTYISSLLAGFLNIEPDNIVIANGASELISAIGHLYIDKLVIPIPTFDEYINRLKIQGKDVSLYEIEDESFTLDTGSYIDFAQKSNANAVLFIQPNNPTGNLIPKATMKRALDELDKHKLVIVDESFIEFAASGEDSSVQEFINTYDNLIIIKSLSKVYGIPGLRIGCAVSGNITRIRKLREELPIWNINSFAQRFIEILKDYRKDFDDSCKKVINTTQILYKELSGMKLLSPYLTESNFVLCRLKSDLKSNELAGFLFDNYKILIHDCTTKAGLDSSFIRVASRTEEDNMELVSAIKAWEKEKN